MEELLKWIYSKLSILGNVAFEDLERDKTGKANINNIEIVYNIPNILQITDNKSRNDMLLEIDVWGRREQVLEIENIIEKIELLEDEIYRDNKVFLIINKNNVFRLNLMDEDKNIRHIKLQFVVRKYK